MKRLRQPVLQRPRPAALDTAMAVRREATSLWPGRASGRDGVECSVADGGSLRHAQAVTRSPHRRG